MRRLRSYRNAVWALTQTRFQTHGTTTSIILNSKLANNDPLEQILHAQNAPLSIHLASLTCLFTLWARSRYNLSCCSPFSSSHLSLSRSSILPCRVSHMLVRRAGVGVGDCALTLTV